MSNEVKNGSKVVDVDVDKTLESIAGLQTENAKSQKVLRMLAMAIKAGATQYAAMFDAKVKAVQAEIAQRTKTIDAAIRAAELNMNRLRGVLDKLKAGAILSESEMLALDPDKFVKLVMGDKKEMDIVAARLKRQTEKLAALKSIKVVA